ncbi:hypothetical protein [Treponema endosymbiont of Eucomonympha sp.]|uniref:hypothetical protein n=1 Tax=Treponema endosymbiont of Eucomonympha sp. TaxID=1580831 RepID=UPI000750F7BD|nr:hypothetical protein [Treponema endosymbiont of Eucomonympha sp.]
MSDHAQDPEPRMSFEQLWALLQENARQMKEQREDFARDIKAVHWEIGNIGNQLGSLIESIVSPNIHRKFNALGYAFTRMNTFVAYKDAHGETIAEVDVLLENGEYALAAEVKSALTVEDVKTHAERMCVLRAYADRHNDERQYLGAIAGIVGKQARDYAHKSGFYVLEQSGDTVRTADPPEAWQPKAW